MQGVGGKGARVLRASFPRASRRGRAEGTPPAAVSLVLSGCGLQPPTPTPSFIIYQWRRCTYRLPLNNLSLVVEGSEDPRRLKIKIKAKILRSGERADAN